MVFAIECISFLILKLKKKIFLKCLNKGDVKSKSFGYIVLILDVNKNKTFIENCNHQHKIAFYVSEIATLIFRHK